MDKGFVILAQDNSKNIYLKCAEALARSIKHTMPDANVSLITDNNVENKNLYDKIIPLPHGDQDINGEWKLINDWQVYEASPYEYTIKLEADLYIPKSIDYWWDILKDRDLVISTTIRNFKQEISDTRVYRKFIDDNSLPDCYNAITYFRKSEIANKFFDITRDIFENWDQYKSILKCMIDEPATTDWVYSLASHIMGPEKTLLPSFTDMSMIHMKRFVNGLPTEDWTDTLIYELFPDVIRINTVPQQYPFHYVKKNFSDKLLMSLQ